MSPSCDPTIVNEHVSTTGLSHGWILNILEKNDPNFKKSLNENVVTSITAHHISMVSGFASKIYKVSIFVDDAKEPCYNVVIKIPTSEFLNVLMDNINEGDEKVDMKEFNATIHNTECDFYDLFKEVENFPIPKVYYTQKLLLEEKQMGAIVMEDLSERAVLLGKGLQAFQIKTIVKHLAYFHSYLLTCDLKWKNVFQRLAYVNDSFIDMQRKCAEKFIKHRPGMFDSYINKMEYAATDPELMEFIFRGCCKEIGIPHLLSLGDLWTNNLMWKIKEDGSYPSELAAFIDFQCVFEGNPAFDMARVLCFCTDGEVRRELETYIFDLYYENLTKYMAEKGKKPEYTVEQFKTAYEYAFVNQAFQMVLRAMMLKNEDGMESKKKSIYRAKHEKDLLCMKFAMEDGVEILERLKPEWLVRGA